MVVYDSGLLKVVEELNNYLMGDGISIIKEAFEFIDGKIHEIYLHINNLDSKIDKVIEKLSKK